MKPSEEKIIRALSTCTSPQGQGSLVRATGLSRSTVSRELKELVRAGKVREIKLRPGVRVGDESEGGLGKFAYELAR